MNIAEAIKSARKAAGMRQGEVARHAGITQTYLSQIENNNKVPAMDVLENICKVCGVPVAILFWNAMSEKDVQPRKREAYRQVKPIVDNLIKSIF